MFDLVIGEVNGYFVVLELNVVGLLMFVIYLGYGILVVVVWLGILWWNSEYGNNLGKVDFYCYYEC